MIRTDAVRCERMATTRVSRRVGGVASLLAAFAGACVSSAPAGPPTPRVPARPPDRRPREAPRPVVIESGSAPATNCPPPRVAHGAYDLGQLPIFSKTLFYLRENYVEDITPRSRELVVKALEAVPVQERAVAIERDPSTPPRWVKVSVAGQECMLNIQRVDAPWGLRSRLQEAMHFVQGYLPPAPSADPDKRLMGIEFALTNGMLSALDRHSRLIDAETYRNFRHPESGPGPTATDSGGIPAPDSQSADPVIATPTRISPGSTVAYVRLPHFTKGVSGELRRALVTATAAAPKGFILDLRDNTGGYLEEAYKVADAFIQTGTLGSVANLKRNQRRDEEAHNDGTEPTGALVVLVNRYTASASELVAAAIKNLGRGVVLGEPTIGAGSLRVVFEVPISRTSEPLGLVLTTARLLAAGGADIEGTGVQPDVDHGWSTEESHRDQDCLRQFATALIATARDPQRATLLATAKSLAGKAVCGPAVLSR